MTRNQAEDAARIALALGLSQDVYVQNSFPAVHPQHKHRWQVSLTTYDMPLVFDKFQDVIHHLSYCCDPEIANKFRIRGTLRLVKG